LRAAGDADETGHRSKPEHEAAIVVHSEKSSACVPARVKITCSALPLSSTV
jgi:hypothetical protein